MTLTEFTALDADKQVEIIAHSGVHIAVREHPHHSIRLYQMDTFYAEIFLCKKDNSIWKVGGFDHPILLQPYLKQIDISSLGFR